MDPRRLDQRRFHRKSAAAHCLASRTCDPAGGPQRVLEAPRRITDKLRFGGVKLIVDGPIRAYAARRRAPGYCGGQPNGLWLIVPSELEASFTPHLRAGQQFSIHSSEDEASECVLDAIERMLERHPHDEHSDTLQQCQGADESQLRRSASLGMCVNFFLSHSNYWGDAQRERTVAEAWARRMSPARTALRLGMTVGVHSDAPILSAPRRVLARRVFLDEPLSPLAQPAHESRWLGGGAWRRVSADHTQLGRFVLTTQQVFDRSALKAVLRDLRWCILRANGVAWLADRPGWTLLQMAGSRMVPSRAPEPVRPGLVLIGCFGEAHPPELALRLPRARADAMAESIH